MRMATWGGRSGSSGARYSAANRTASTRSSARLQTRPPSESHGLDKKLCVSPDPVAEAKRRAAGVAGVEAVASQKGGHVLSGKRSLAKRRGGHNGGGRVRGCLRR